MRSKQQPEAGDMVLDRRVNIVSLANLATLMALLLTAIGTWYGLINRVDTLNIRVDSLTTELTRTRAEALTLRAAGENDVREMRGKIENLSIRSSVMETQVGSILTTVNRMDKRMESARP